MKTLFWTLLGLTVYCYAGYPVLVALVARVRRKPVAKHPYLPSVTVVIAVHNEEDVIRRKIDNLLLLDYPADQLDILIGSDGSTDRTVEIIESYQNHRLKVIAHPQRRGKMSTLNELVAQSRSEIIVFNDARQTLERDAVRQLTANFSDPLVGCVSGELVFSQAASDTAKSINAYWEYEKFIRDQESQIHSMLGATGAIYAIRRELFVPGPANIILDDMYTPFRIIERGRRAIFDGTAHANDRAAETGEEEHRRKTRTIFGNYQIFGLFAGLFNPLKSPIAIQFFSHKLLRVLVPFFMIALLPINAFLAGEEPYAFIWKAHIAFYAAAGLGCLARRQKYGILRVISKVCAIPYVFCLLNCSALVGFFRYLSRRQETTWQKARHNS